LISLSDVSFAYDGRKPALEQVTLRLDAGRTLGLVGPNGSGKSTLLSLLAGLYAPSRGTIRVGDRVAPGEEKAIRSLAGLVMQDADLHILGATVGEDVGLGFESSHPAVMNRVRETAERFGLAPLWDRPVQALSWGQKRRLCLAGVLAREPELLLLDEPFSGLDYPGIKEMRAVLDENRRQGLTQIVTAHDLEPLADLADEWAVMSEGRLVLAGRADEVFDRLEEYGVRAPCSWQAGLGVRAWNWKSE